MKLNKLNAPTNYGGGFFCVLGAVSTFGGIGHWRSWAVGLPVFDLLGVEKVCASVEFSNWFRGSAVGYVVRPCCGGDAAMGGAVFVAPKFDACVFVDNDWCHYFARRFSSSSCEITRVAGTISSQLGTLSAASMNAANINANAYVISFLSCVEFGGIPPASWCSRGNLTFHLLSPLGRVPVSSQVPFGAAPKSSR